MRALCPAFAIASLLCAAIPAQTPGAAIQGQVPGYPTDLAMDGFAPFVDSAGAPLRVAAKAVGIADLDGDHNPDVWFLGDGAQTGEVAVRLANSAGLGRFHRRDSMKSSSFVTGATFHTSSLGVDQLLMVDPNSDQLSLLNWYPRVPKGDPRDGYLGGGPSGWKTGTGVYEIVTADVDRNGHDEILVLRSLPNNGTEVIKLVMGTVKNTYLSVDSTVSVVLPVRLEMLQVLDVDGDRQADFAAHAPGYGVVTFRDSGQGSFVFDRFLPFAANTVVDLAAGDLDLNRCDDLAICLRNGVIVLRHHPVGNPDFPSGFDYQVFPNPVGVGNLATCRILDGNGRGTGGGLLLGFPADGSGVVAHPGDPQQFGSSEPWVQPAPADLSGPGPLGRFVLVGDFDNDHDPDVLLQAPSGKEWLPLRNPTVSFAPLAIADEPAKIPAPQGEGTHLNVTVTVPQALVDEGVLFLEVGAYVVDPESSNENDPEYLYWGRLTPPIDPNTNTVSFGVYYQTDMAAWDQLRRDFKKYRHIGGGAKYVYPPEKYETMRGGPGQFFTLHGVDRSKRFESSTGDPLPPKKGGSTLGGKWKLKARPPSLKGDVELLPWE